MGIVFGSTIYWALHRSELPQVFLARAGDFTIEFPIDSKGSSYCDIARLVLDLLFIGTVKLRASCEMTIYSNQSFCYIKVSFY